MKMITPTITLLASLVLVSGLHAATIVYSGSVLDNSGNEVTEWRTSSTTKSLDADGDNIYGTFGGIAFGDAVFGAMDFVSAQPQVGNAGSGYVIIDDVTIGDPDRMVRTTTNNANTGLYGTSDSVMYTFELNTAVEAWETLRVGIGTDGLNNVNFSPGSIGLAEVGGGGGLDEVSITVNNTVDMYFFDVTGGVAAGTQFQVFADPGAGGYVTHQLVSLDVAVPEPSSVALLGIGGLAVLLRRRR